MIKRLIKICMFLITIALIAAGVFTYGMYFSVKQVQVTYQTIISNKIPKSLDDTRIAYISDFKLNAFMDYERLEGMISKLQNTGCDILIFGGDMFFDVASTPLNSDLNQKVITLLKDIHAPLGKFAVLGEDDQINDETKASITDILFQSDFELLENSNIRLRNNAADSISLIGINSLTPDYEKAFSSINNDEFTMLLMHYPDTMNAKEISAASADVALSGHSLGGQIYIPLLGGIVKMDGATSYYRGMYTIGETQLYVSNGLGTQSMDMRLFAPPQISMYRLSRNT